MSLDAANKKPCPTCKGLKNIRRNKGKGLKKCPTCHGTGIDPAQETPGTLIAAKLRAECNKMTLEERTEAYNHAMNHINAEVINDGSDINFRMGVVL